MVFSKVRVVSQDIDGCIDREGRPLPLAKENAFGHMGFSLGEFRDLNEEEKKGIKELSQRIEKLELKQFYLNTGRSLGFVTLIAKEFQKHLSSDIFRYVICESGALVYDLEKEEKLDVLEIARQNGLSRLEKLYESEMRKIEKVKAWLKEGGEKTTVKELAEFFKVKEDRLNFLVWDYSFNFSYPKELIDEREMALKLKAFFREREIKELSELVVYASQFCFDIVAYLSKAMGLEVLLAHQGLEASETVHIGDGGNDLCAMAYSGTCASPSNANDLVKIMSYFCGAVSKKSHCDGIIDLYEMIYEEKAGGDHC